MKNCLHCKNFDVGTHISHSAVGYGLCEYDKEAKGKFKSFSAGCERFKRSGEKEIKDREHLDERNTVARNKIVTLPKNHY